VGYALPNLRFDHAYFSGNQLRHALFIVALMFCIRAAAEEASIHGVWQLQTVQLQQQLELNKDGTYQRSIATIDSRRTEVGRWHSDVSVLVLQPDYVITTQGSRVPLPPREKQIDVAGVDANSLTLYYDGDALETWHRPQSATPPSQQNAASPMPIPIERRPPRAIVLPTPQVTLSSVQITAPAMPEFLMAARMRTSAAVTTFEPVPLATTAAAQPSMPDFAIAEEAAVATAAPPSMPPAVVQPIRFNAPEGLYAESQVVELITQIACEELRYPQRDLVKSEQRYQQLAQALGFESRDPTRLQRTLRYYQSNTEFMRAHQQSIAENSMRCVMEREQVSVVQ